LAMFQDSSLHAVFRAELAAGLSASRPEIEQALAARVRAIPDNSEMAHPEYVEGLRMAVAAGLDYGLAAVKSGENDAVPIPPPLYAQARMAAGAKIGLDIVLRRYVAGNSVLTDFIFQEATTGLVPGASLREVLRSQTMFLDRLIAGISDEYTREAARLSSSPGRQELEGVRRLLAGELIDVSRLNYELDASHVGLIAKGLRSGDALRGLAAEMDKRILAVHPEEGITWAWLGSRDGITSTDLASIHRSRPTLNEE